MVKVSIGAGLVVVAWEAAARAFVPRSGPALRGVAFQLPPVAPLTEAAEP